MLKAARESQVHTSWVNPDPAYEDALQQFVRAALDASRPNPFLEDFAALREMVAHAGAINALAQQLLKLTAPGVPDIYQGTELWDQSLVDPDNRRPVDYAQRTRLLRGLQRRRPGRRLAADLLETKADGRVKLYLTSRALACRAAYPDLFARGDYIPLAAEGAAADHVVAFARRDAENEFIVVVPRLVVGLTRKELVDPIGPEVWGDTRLLLPDAEPGTRYRDVFSGETIKVSASDDGVNLPLARSSPLFPSRCWNVPRLRSLPIGYTDTSTSSKVKRRVSPEQATRVSGLTSAGAERTSTVITVAGSRCCGADCVRSGNQLRRDRKFHEPSTHRIALAPVPTASKERRCRRRWCSSRSRRRLPHHFTGVVVTSGINLLPDHRFEFWSQGHVHPSISLGAIAKFDMVPAGGFGPGLAIGRRGSLGIDPQPAGRTQPGTSSFERDATRA